MSRQAFILLIAVLAGICIGAFVASKLASDVAAVGEVPEIAAKTVAEQLLRDKRSDVDSEHLAQVVESLVQILDEEISERRILAEQLKEMQSEVTDLKQNLRVRVEEAFAMERNSGQQQSNTEVGETIEERLAAVGFTRQQLESIQRLEAEARMRQVELDDRARREGWINSPRYLEESEKISTGATTTRELLGDDTYDRYLFASGRPNRVAVESIIETSPAEKAGFQHGDVIMSYGGETVYSTQQLVRLRSSGERGAPVTVEVIRNGQLTQITMPRGPMGLNTGPTQVDPSAAGDR